MDEIQTCTGKTRKVEIFYYGIYVNLLEYQG